MTHHEWAYEFPGWMAGREFEIKEWFRGAMHPEGCVGFAFRHRIGTTGYTLDESHYYDPQTGGWS